jgi:hypothetical protein
VEGFVFVIYLERSLGSIRWIGLLWRQFVSAALMFAAMWGAWSIHPLIGLAAGPLVYAAALIALRAIGPEERRLWGRLRGGNEG